MNAVLHKDNAVNFLPEKIILENVSVATLKMIAPRSLADARIIAREVSKDLDRRTSVRYAELQQIGLTIVLEFFAVAVGDPSIRRSVWSAVLDDDLQSFDAGDYR